MNIWKWEYITRGDNDPYLTRLTVFGCSLFKIMIHWFHDSDDECLHDHPWPFVSLIVKGGYWEYIPGLSIEDYARHLKKIEGIGAYGSVEHVKWYKPWTILYRSANWIHRIVIDKNNKPVTLVVTGPKNRNWGFWTTFGWILHSNYLKGTHCD